MTFVMTQGHRDKPKGRTLYPILKGELYIQSVLRKDRDMKVGILQVYRHDPMLTLDTCQREYLEWELVQVLILVNPIA